MKRETILWWIIIIQFVFFVALIAYGIVLFTDMRNEQLEMLQTSIPSENAIYRENVMTFTKGNRILLEECAQDFCSFRSSERQRIDSLSLDDSGQLIARYSQGEIQAVDLPQIQQLLSETIVETISMSSENGVQAVRFETDYTDGSWDDGLYYSILYNSDDRLNVDNYEPFENGWIRSVNDDVFYLERVCENFFYSFEAWD